MLLVAAATVAVLSALNLQPIGALSIQRPEVLYILVGR